MLKITRNQIKALDAVPLGTFLKKATKFLLEEAPDEMSLIADPAAFVKEQYDLAKKAGHRSERAIVRCMLDVLTNKTQ